MRQDLADIRRSACVLFRAVSAGSGNLSKLPAVGVINDLLSIYDKSRSVPYAIVCHIRLG